MRAVQIVAETGPAEGLAVAELPEPDPVHPRTGKEGVVVEVRAAGVAFPELLQSRGLYQERFPLPFVPGGEVAGVVRSAPAGTPHRTGDRVMAFCMIGGFAETAVAPAHLTFPLPEQLDWAEGAGLVLNYQTAHFALVRRGRLTSGETVLVHGAAGGVGSAALQVARGLGARTIAVVSGDEKEAIARRAGADHVLRSDGPWKDEAIALSGGGVDLVLDPVGGDRFTDSLRSLAQGGRVVVVGFSAGSIPEVRVNRLMFNNTEVVGAGWGGVALADPAIAEGIAMELDRLVREGFVRPIISARFPLERAGEALALLEDRRALGKIVLEISSD